jgi:hypothetical protein
MIADAGAGRTAQKGSLFEFTDSPTDCGGGQRKAQYQVPDYLAKGGFGIDDFFGVGVLVGWTFPGREPAVNDEAPAAL